jgi:hypothetical protein
VRRSADAAEILALHLFARVIALPVPFRVRRDPRAVARSRSARCAARRERQVEKHRAATSDC